MCVMRDDDRVDGFIDQIEGREIVQALADRRNRAASISFDAS